MHHKHKAVLYYNNIQTKLNVALINNDVRSCQVTNLEYNFKVGLHMRVEMNKIKRP